LATPRAAALQLCVPRRLGGAGAPGQQPESTSGPCGEAGRAHSRQGAGLGRVDDVAMDGIPCERGGAAVRRVRCGTARPLPWTRKVRGGYRSRRAAPRAEHRLRSRPQVGHTAGREAAGRRRRDTALVADRGAAARGALLCAGCISARSRTRHTPRKDHRRPPVATRVAGGGVGQNRRAC